MSTFVSDGEFVHDQRATVTISEEAKSVKVTYRGEGDARFRVVVHQKSNPIGFAARLPGDKRR